MKNSLLKIFAFFLLFSFNSCLNYETQFEGPYSDDEDRIPVQLDKELVFVAQGDVYLANEFVADIEKIDATGVVDIASINNNHTKVIFKRFVENIKIYDISKKMIIEEIPNSESAIWFDYHANSSTVYFLKSNGLLETYGPEVLAQHPLNLKTQTNPNATNIYSAAILENGNFIYSYSYGSTEKLIISDGGNIIDELATSSGINQIRFSKDEKYFWGQHDTYADLFQSTIPNLSSSIDSYYKLGAPTKYESGFDSYKGYKIRNDNNIIMPGNDYIPHSYGTITSIDY